MKKKQIKPGSELRFQAYSEMYIQLGQCIAREDVRFALTGERNPDVATFAYEVLLQINNLLEDVEAPEASKPADK